MTKPLIYLITEGILTAGNFDENKNRILETIKNAVENKIPLVQIREKNLPAKLVFELTSQAVKITDRTDTKLLVNDRADIALAAKADGVHLTGNSISAKIIRQHFPGNFILGVSTHSIEKAEQAKTEGADFVTFSPIFASPGKVTPAGLEKLREVCEKLKPFPVIALGGIDETNYNSVLEKGASGFAAIRFLNEIKNLKMISRTKAGA
ncbi:MAG: thiamine phosphate synthase [Pyrinomonadaceae bacterium]